MENMLDSLMKSNMNKYYLNFVVQASDICFKTCIDDKSLNNKKIEFSGEEKKCVEDCFTKYYLSYNSISKLIGDK